jgi:cytochrome c
MRTRFYRCAVLQPFAALIIATAPAAPVSPVTPLVPQKTPPPGSSVRGADIYEAKCGACHSMDANRIGPKHRGVFGRKSGIVPGFSYSPALKKLNVVWNAQTLDRWLQNPTAMARGTTMGYRLSVAQDRADVIAFLRMQSLQQ